jgi:O-antigen/teichoic acid export membrane protein
MKATEDTVDGDALVAANTVWMLLSHGSKLMIQAVYFVMMARNLGPEQYGGFIAVTSIAAIVGPFVGNGANNLMVKNVSKDHQRFHEYFGSALLTTLISGLVLSGVVIAVCVVALPGMIPVFVILLVALSEALLLRFVDVAMLAFQAVEKLRSTAWINVFVSLTRVAGLATIVVLERPTLVAWSIAYAVTAVIASSVAVYYAVRELGAPRFTQGHWRQEVREGFYFSVGLSAQTIYNDIDKSMLARWSSLDSTGVYAAAYRLVDVAFVPVRALLAATYPGFFRSGAGGIRGSLAHARRWMPRAVGYSSAVTVALVAVAPLVPYALGPQYLRSTQALRWLSVLPLLKTLQYFAADTLTGAGFQGVRTLMQIGVAAFNVALNLWTIPAYGWRGAAWSSLAADAVLAATLWSSVILLRSRHRGVDAKVPAVSPTRAT